MTEQNHFYLAPGGEDSNPGTIERPWKTLSHAAEVLQAGQTVYLRGGIYRLDCQARVCHSGREDAWIVLTSYPGEQAVIDASDVQPAKADRPPAYCREQGALHMEGVGYIRIQNLTIQKSHWAGICVIDSQHIDLINNTTDGSFSSGISIWDTTRQGICHHHRVLGNTVIHATTWDMIPKGYRRGSEPPHEAISIGGANDFVVAYNHVYDCDKEGIDIKETSKRGIVHHNYVHHVDRQGLYADAWFGVLEDIEFCNNVVHDCGGSGVALSVEDVEILRDVRIHHNLIYDNKGTGIYVSRWGKDGPRSQISIHHNTVHHNGWGKPKPGDAYYYITGGLFLNSANLKDTAIHHNIFSDNCGFQIGHSDQYLMGNETIETALIRRGIDIENNLVHDRNPPCYPIRFAWTGSYFNAYGFNGKNAILAEPSYANPQQGDFRLAPAGPSEREMGAYSEGANSEGADSEGADSGGADLDFWWKADFPPKMMG